MNDKLIISSNNVFSSMTQVVLILSYIILSSFIDIPFAQNAIFNFIFKFIQIAFFFFIISLSHTTYIRNGYIIKGIHIIYIGNLKRIFSLPISEIENVYLKQNGELYFEIVAKRTNGDEFVLKKLPNKNPANAEQELIRNYL